MKSLKSFDRGRETKSANAEFESAKEKYGGMDENALISELRHKIGEAKENGTFNKAQMESYIEYLSPYLTTEQKKIVSDIVNE